MKLIIQIPCFNEADTLPLTLANLPRHIDGIDKVEWLVIDDGSADNTAQIAEQCGVDHVIKHIRNQGLAKAFMTGVDACLKLKADIIVNTDADNQYNADDIPELVNPILDGSADFVIGSRPISSINHFSSLKKILQKFGSWSVRVASKTDIVDAPSGFRAISREAALRLNVFNEYTYTLETIIQAGQKNMSILSVPIRVNGITRPSRLIKSIPFYIYKSLLTISRIFVVYRPFRFFMSIGVFLFTLGFLLGIRFLLFYLGGEGSGHIQSVILSGILLVIGFQTILVGIIADLLSVNRKILEDIQLRIKLNGL